MYDLVIKNGTLVTASNTFAADVAVDGEQIAAIGRGLAGRREIDATGLLVLPGAVDIHVHMQMPLPGDIVSADDFYTGTRAAAFGGTTTIVDFVDATDHPTLVDAIAARRAEADPNVVIDYGLHMTLGPTEIGRLDQVPAAAAAGCTTFKLYMAYGFRLNDFQLMRALEAVRDVDGLAVVHAENWEIITALVARDLRAGRTTPHWHPRSRPAIMEGEATGRVIDLATLVGARIHIFHVSCGAAVDRIAAARAAGLPVTGETCPQYLFLTHDVYDAPGVAGALPVCAPPIRSAAEQVALWRALSHGDLQVVSTDHCPFVRADKARGLDDYSLIPGGVPSIEMRLAALYSGGVRSGRLSLTQWVDACCATPARVTGLTGKGDIAPGFDADLVLFDPSAAWTVSTDTLHENVDWTPYPGLELVGRPRQVFSRGRLVVDGDAFLGERGAGRYISRYRATTTT